MRVDELPQIHFNIAQAALDQGFTPTDKSESRNFFCLARTLSGIDRKRLVVMIGRVSSHFYVAKTPDSDMIQLQVFPHGQADLAVTYLNEQFRHDARQYRFDFLPVKP